MINPSPALAFQAFQGHHSHRMRKRLGSRVILSPESKNDSGRHYRSALSTLRTRIEDRRQMRLHFRSSNWPPTGNTSHRMRKRLGSRVILSPESKNAKWKVLSLDVVNVEKPNRRLTTDKGTFLKFGGIVPEDQSIELSLAYRWWVNSGKLLLQAGRTHRVTSRRACLCNWHINKVLKS